jgi:hypothetical protein
MQLSHEAAAQPDELLSYMNRCDDHSNPLPLNGDSPRRQPTSKEIDPAGGVGSGLSCS